MTVCNVLQRDCVTRSGLEFGKKIASYGEMFWSILL